MKEGAMPEEDDRLAHESGGGAFVMGLLTGTVLGAGLGMLFAPRPGSELRGQISERASEGYRRASKTAESLTERGREISGKAQDSVSAGIEEAQRHIAKAASGRAAGPSES
jgi:gas vesicle protein